MCVSTHVCVCVSMRVCVCVFQCVCVYGGDGMESCIAKGRTLYLPCLCWL